MSWLTDPRVASIARGAFVLGLCLSVLSNGVAIRIAHEAQGKTERVIEQRTQDARLADRTTCAVLTAIIDAGRSTIRASASAQTGRFYRNLRALGYPPRKEREATAAVAAESYELNIVDRVAAITGRTDLVRKDGTPQCKELGPR